ncbi:hypothetical protein TNIN_187131 [Trichonephila inaurata madagascariensis]|uniref:Uncharacterized protein n=1 Tax=Trichonephila inaurata madagascariensis TaxID=2747483 RepID=A0A8X6IDV1_9ARAC|nr:hypothetical protein TNIN_187131 [Trichonephila inaurata madagascariensis]
MLDTFEQNNWILRLLKNYLISLNVLSLRSSSESRSTFFPPTPLGKWPSRSHQVLLSRVDSKMAAGAGLARTLPYLSGQADRGASAPSHVTHVCPRPQ